MAGYPPLNGEAAGYPPVNGVQLNGSNTNGLPATYPAVLAAEQSPEARYPAPAYQSQIDATTSPSEVATGYSSGYGSSSEASVPSPKPYQEEAGVFTEIRPSAGGKPLPGDPTCYQAPAFNEVVDEEALKREKVPVRAFNRTVHINWLGWAVMLFYFGALGFYIWVRATKTLNLGAKYEWYGIFVLVLECFGATTVWIYGINLLWISENVDVPPYDPQATITTRMPYHIRIMVPCYKESLEIIQKTVEAAAAAPLPEGCQRTIYLCDDGKDQAKREWFEELGEGYVYVSGRIRKKGEMNGKSNNMNNALRQIYPENCYIPPTELICIFDADQVAKPQFFLRTVPMFDAGDDVGMVLTPQYNEGLNEHCDVFNHTNLHFWEYMQPGYDALDFISCTGTNFLIRSNAYQQAGWTPTWTLTEDFALGLELKKDGWHCRYLKEYLAGGEAPDGVRNCFQQRSRWTKGHFQIIFNMRRCPLLQRKLNLFNRCFYCSGVWCYIVCAITTPIFIALPIVTIWAGVFPLVINWWAALGITIYTAANLIVLYYFRAWSHLKALWFANLANQMFFFVYAKAFWRSFTSAFCCQAITFKATAKGKGKLGNSAFRDMWMPCLLLLIQIITLAVAIFQLVTGAVIVSPLAISAFWVCYNMIPQLLLVTYAIAGRGYTLTVACYIAMLFSIATAVITLVLVWAIKHYAPSEFTGGAIHNNVYIGFANQISHWIQNGFHGLKAKFTS